MQRYRSDFWFLIAVVCVCSLVLNPSDTSAHPAPAGWDVVGRNPDYSTYPHLDWYEVTSDPYDPNYLGTFFESQINVAKAQWNAQDRVIIGNTVNTAKMDLFVRDVPYQEGCDVSWLGQYNSPGMLGLDYGAIYFNRCNLMWEGGIPEWTDTYRGPTTETRRRRTAVHEFGHAMGIAHPESSFLYCEAIMRAGVRIDAETCYQPKDHDKQDLADYHPNA